MQKNNIIISLVFLATGFISAYLIFGYPTQDQPVTSIIHSETEEKISLSSNPFTVKNNINSSDLRITSLEQELELVKKQLLLIQTSLDNLTQLPANNTPVPVTTRQQTINKNRFSSALTQRLYNLDTLIKGGLDPALAEHIVRRKNSIELKRLALQDLATRENRLHTQSYFDELEDINRQDITLREELGDARYDDYLYNSKQNNRIRIASVMLGSVAEQVGIEKNDIVLSYDDSRMFSWQELKDATAAGELGEYVSLSIYRNGDIYSFSVPRGPLGVQLGAARLAP